jgi:hypothetical protein
VERVKGVNNPTTKRGVAGYFYDPAKHGTFIHNPADKRPRAERRKAAREWAKLERIAQRGEP